MSLYDYRASLEISRRSYPFYSLIMAAMLQADTTNVEKLKAAFPGTWVELNVRYHAPGGVLDDETIEPASEGGCVDAR